MKMERSVRPNVHFRGRTWWWTDGGSVGEAADKDAQLLSYGAELMLLLEALEVERTTQGVDWVVEELNSVSDKFK